MNDFNRMEPDTFAIVGGRTQTVNQNEGVYPIFFVSTEEDGAATEKAGALRTRDMECVKIVTAGDMLSAATQPVDENIRRRWPNEYSAWKTQNTNDHVEGTRIEEWPLAPKGIIMELKAIGIRSVEDLGSVADANIARVSDGMIWKRKAQGWLESSKKHGAAARLAAENQRLSDQILALQKQMADLAARLPDNSDKAA